MVRGEGFPFVRAGMKCGGDDGHIIRIKFNMNDLSQRLRELSDVLIGCEWEVPLCASEDCIKAANEIERMTRDIGSYVEVAQQYKRERDEARKAASFMHENAEDVAAGRCFGLMQAWPWLESEAAGGE